MHVDIYFRWFANLSLVGNPNNRIMIIVNAELVLFRVKCLGKWVAKLENILGLFH